MLKNIEIIVRLLGAAIMLCSLCSFIKVIQAIKLVKQEQKAKLYRFIIFVGLMIIIFFFGYLAVTYLYFKNESYLNNTLVSLILLLGAIFVFFVVELQKRMLTAIISTITNLLPMCSSCHKIRTENSDPQDQISWERVDTYLTKRKVANITHGICPECMEKHYHMTPEDINK